tara:strand:+ start:1499 stop:2407 length:909 start_codon:yes stop_codon:yes gene_type:complete
MGLSITSNFSGDHAGQYISAALKSAKSLDYLTVLENVKYKRNITKVVGSTLVRNATCDFTDSGTLTMTEKVLTPKNLQINVDLCKGDLLADWQALQMTAGANNNGMSADFSAFVMSHLAEQIANSTETSCWTGAAANNGEFEGFLTSTTGMYALDAPTSSSASAAYTAANIVANLQTLVADIPANVYAKASEDLYIYMNPKTYRFYISAISTLGYVNAYNMQSDYTPYFEGIKIAVVGGISDNVMVAAEKGNQFFGTDLLSDATQISMLDMAKLDGSDNLRVVCKYSAGVQTGVASDITKQA